MTPKPKTRKAPMSGAIAQAIARCDAAQAPIDARSGQIDDAALANQLFTAVSDAVDALADMPCTNDAEFIEKLRYLYAQQAKIWDLPGNGDDYGCILIAAACHFCPVNV
jgi:hypothetical protein